MAQKRLIEATCDRCDITEQLQTRLYQQERT